MQNFIKSTSLVRNCCCYPWFAFFSAKILAYSSVFIQDADFHPDKPY